MAQTPDRQPGEASEEGIVFDNRPAGQDPVALGGLRFVDGIFKLLDAVGLYDPRDNARYLENGANEIFAEDLGTASLIADRVMVTDGLGGWIVSNFALIESLPAELNFNENVPQQATTSSTPVLDLRLTTDQSDPAGLQGGTYIIFGQATLSGTQNGTVIGAETVLDAGTGGEEILNSYIGRPGSNQGELQFFSHAVRVLTAGIHTVDINFYKASGGGSAQIEQARITLWRVAE